MTRTLISLSTLLSLFGFSIARAGNPPLFPDGVGSNLVFHELGAYANNPTGENWGRDVNVTLLHYHEKPDEVRARLKTMRAGGQTKIALMLWYIQDGNECTYHSHVICPKNGKIPPQIESNIRNILKDIAAAGFDTVIMRLAAQGLADPLAESYEAARAQDSWKLFETVYAISASAVEGTKLKVLYDLGTETMGHPYSVRPGAQAFLKLMWTNYAKKYSAAKTVGFSFNHAFDPATLESLRIYENNGTWPGAISVDVYQDPDKVFENLSKALKSFGKADYPVIVNETFRNNAEMAKAFADNQRKYGLNFRFLLQWPLDKGAAGHSNNPLSPDIDAYLSVTKQAAQ